MTDRGLNELREELASLEAAKPPNPAPALGALADAIVELGDDEAAEAILAVTSAFAWVTRVAALRRQILDQVDAPEGD